jgi:hypothetical protein
VKQKQQGENNMAAQIHNAGDVGKAIMWIAGVAVFVVVALTWVPDWISPEGTNGTGNTGGMAGAGVGVTTRMIEKELGVNK